MKFIVVNHIPSLQTACRHPLRECNGCGAAVSVFYSMAAKGLRVRFNSRTAYYEPHALLVMVRVRAVDKARDYCRHS